MNLPADRSSDSLSKFLMKALKQQFAGEAKREDILEHLKFFCRIHPSEWEKFEDDMDRTVKSLRDEGYLLRDGDYGYEWGIWKVTPQGEEYLFALGII